MANSTFVSAPDSISNPDTPTETPGTPNSTTTTLSSLSTTAIKDGHRGSLAHPHPAFPFPSSTPSHRHHPSTHTLEAERADRISRLAGLERVATVRPTSNPLSGASPNPSPGPAPGVSGIFSLPGQNPPIAGSQGSQSVHGLAYFDASGNPVVNTRMSTVGSASATSGPGSAGARTTWGEGDRGEEGDDGMSVDTNFREDAVSAGVSAMYEDVDGHDEGEEDDGDGMSDQASLVGFGEGAGSTVSGPIYGREIKSPVAGRGALAGAAILGREGSFTGAAGSSGVASPVAGMAVGTESNERTFDTRHDAYNDGRSHMAPTESNDGLGKHFHDERN